MLKEKMMTTKMTAELEDLVEQLDKILAQLAEDVGCDIWYDSRSFEKDYPDDSYTLAINRVRQLLPYK